MDVLISVARSHTVEIQDRNPINLEILVCGNPILLLSLALNHRNIHIFVVPVILLNSFLPLLSLLAILRAVQEFRESRVRKPYNYALTHGSKISVVSIIIDSIESISMV